MAAVLNFDRLEAPTREESDRAIETIIAHVSSLPARLAVPRIAEYKARLDAAEAVSLATVIDSTGSTRVAEAISNKGKTSTRTRKRAAKRAAAIKKNATLADKMASGDLSSEHVDVLADAATKTKGASLTDESLINSVANANPDLGKSIIDKYLLDKDGAAGEQTRHDRQRTKRRATRFRTKDDCEAIMIAGDKATIDRIWAQTTRIANRFYQQDGGRDISPDQHPRNHDQRFFDAITGPLTAPRTDSDNAHSTSTSNNPAPEPKPRPTTSKRVTKPRSSEKEPRPVIVVGVTLDKFSGKNTKQAAELLGHGPIADSVLADYLGTDPDIVGAVFGTHGEPLWLGRRVRLATKAQWLALVIRDKHCVRCGAPHARCRAHHTQPWNAPQGGPTNIDSLVMVCNSCHHHIHDNHQTIYRDRTSGEWKLRHALPHEIPPQPPSQPGQGESPMRT